MKEMYESAELEIVELEAEDILTILDDSNETPDIDF